MQGGVIDTLRASGASAPGVLFFYPTAQKVPFRRLPSTRRKGTKRVFCSIVRISQNALPLSGALGALGGPVLTVRPCIPVRSKPSAPYKVRSGTSNCVHTPLIGCDHHCWMADILSLVSSTNAPLAVYRTIIDSSDHPFLGLSGRVSAPPFRHKPHAAGESCSHARSSLYGQPLDCPVRGSQRNGLSFMSLIPCICSCIYQKDGLCALDCAAAAGLPRAADGCVHFIPVCAERPAEPPQCLAPGSAPAPPAHGSSGTGAPGSGSA